MSTEFKELKVEELARGYIENECKDKFTCIFCGENFEDGLIYTSRDRNVTAKRAVQEHVMDAHGGVFNSLIILDKQINGLSDLQKNLLNLMYEEKDNKRIGEKMEISPATVRTHKFNFQKMKREAKIFLALLEQIENQEYIDMRKKYEINENDLLKRVTELTEDFNGNTLHPFFTQCNFK